MTEAKYLDISETISDEEYRTVLGSLLEQFETWRRDNSWCTDLYYHVARLTRTFKWDTSGYNSSISASGYSGAMELNIPAERSGAERAQDLRELRGRVLRFTIEMPEYLTTEKANEFLTTAGLQPHHGGNRTYNADFTGFLSTALTREEIEKKVNALIKKLGVTGNVGFYLSEHGGSGIPRQDTTELLRRR
jgi:hypothetical protein